MGFWDKIFKTQKKETINQISDSVTRTEKCREILRLKDVMDDMLSRDLYIAKSEYLSVLPEFERTIEYFNVLIDSGSVDNYCKENVISSSLVKDICRSFENFESLVDQHNEKYTKQMLQSEKDYLDNILKDVDSNILLDEEQRRVVLNDEDYCLVIAGAGAGKTTTVAAKVRYLVEKKNIDPAQILVISFTNKAVQELQEKINRDLKIDCPISTFHSTGYAILNRHSPEKFNIVDSGKLYYVIQDYFRGNILKDEAMVKNLIMFFASYFDAPYNESDLNTFFNRVAKANFATLKSDLNEYETQIMDTRTKKRVTIQNEVLRSNQEVEIANFLYLNNIDYEYEPIYKYNILLSRKPYTPDFIIRQGDKVAYIEHFGITEAGENNRYSETELLCYKRAVNDKIRLHQKHGTDLIYTFSAYNDRRELLDHLKEELLKHGFELKQRPDNEVLAKLVASEENRYIRKLVALICRFISNFKTNGYTSEEFDSMRRLTNNVRRRSGNAQPKLNVFDVAEIPIPTMSVEFEKKISDLVMEAYNHEKLAKLKLKEAMDLLLKALDFEDGQFCDQSTSIRSYKDIVSAKRIDAEYYQHKYDAIKERIKVNRYMYLGDACNIYDNNYNPDKNIEYRYIELSNIGSLGLVTGCTVACGKELPTRARRKVNMGNIILSSIEGSLQSCALVTEEYDDAMHSPKKMLQIIGKKSEFGALPLLEKQGLRDCQYKAEINLEKSLKSGNKKNLAILATGSGKTYLACLASYRMLNYTSTKRVLFLVDRNNLARQTESEFNLFDRTEKQQSLSDLYKIKRLRKASDIKGDIVISTIQKLFGRKQAIWYLSYMEKL